LGRFKLTGIPAAAKGVPQIQVSFDLDANGILQVTALDKYTGREQSITVQGASTLKEEEVNRMIQEAEKFADEDRLRRERIEKRNRSQDLINRSERQLREAALDFGPQFALDLRRQVETLSRELRDSVARDDDRQIDLNYAALQEVLYELAREVYQSSQDLEEEDDLFQMPSMSSFSQIVSKGMEAVRGQPSSASSRRPPTRVEEEAWEDWDDDW
jgi:molecular chaperone DnaK